VRVLSGLSALAVTAALAVPAAAHLALRSPPSRYGAGVLKVGPCGQAGGARTDNVTELEPGATIEVVWDEYVNHPGHFRISFDVDGDDDFVDPACLSGCDTRSPEIERYSNDTVLLDGIADTPEGGQSSASVTLPDVECDRCTLQVIQVMYDKPPYVTPGNDIYYQCADLVLRREAVPSATPTPPCGPDELAPCVGTCAGDCDSDGEVGVNELLTIVRIALGADDVAACPAGDVHGGGTIQVDEIAAAVYRSLRGCGDDDGSRLSSP
jgi:hypothetical protein